MINTDDDRRRVLQWWADLGDEQPEAIATLIFGLVRLAIYITVAAILAHFVVKYW